jgi:putative membrane protein
MPCSRLPFVLLGLYILEAVVLGIAPVDRKVWWAENLTAWIPIAVVCLLYWRKVCFSNTAYLLMWLFFTLHTIGGHFTFANVPMQTVTDLCAFQRNHYDRICHFLVGVFAYPAMEYFDRNNLIRGRTLMFILTVLGIFGFAAIFEIIEWIYAVVADPEAGIMFLGSQGDVWDAQKDMLADGLGAICFAGLYCWTNRNKNDSTKMARCKSK